MACPQNHSCNLHAPFCGTFVSNLDVVARYDALIRNKFPTNCDAHLTESIFQTHTKTGFQAFFKLLNPVFLSWNIFEKCLLLDVRYNF